MHDTITLLTTDILIGTLILLLTVYRATKCSVASSTVLHLQIHLEFPRLLSALPTKGYFARNMDVLLFA